MQVREIEILESRENPIILVGIKEAFMASGILWL